MMTWFELIIWMIISQKWHNSPLKYSQNKKIRWIRKINHEKNSCAGNDDFCN